MTYSPRSTPCDGCHAGCCRSFAVPISGADALRLEETGLSFWDFATRWEDRTGAIANGYAPHLFFEDDPGTPFVLGLSHVESRVFPGTPKCRFLSETDPTAEHPLGVGNCGMYEGRPAACRVFPKKLDDRGELVQLQPIPARGNDRPDDVFNLCPRPWTAADVDPIEAPAEIVVAEHEMRFFAKVVALWNRQPGEWRAFPAFLRKVYTARVQDPPAVIPTVPQDADPVILKFDAAAARPRRQPAPQTQTPAVAAERRRAA